MEPIIPRRALATGHMGSYLPGLLRPLGFRAPPLSLNLDAVWPQVHYHGKGMVIVS
jgi:hypothetical protein